MIPSTTQRRWFLRQLSLGMGAAVGLPALARAMPGGHSTLAPSESWLDGLTGKHRQFFDVAAHGAGSPLVRAGSFLDTYAHAYGLKDTDVNVVFGAHGTGVSLVFGSALWKKYDLGAIYGVEDPATKTPAMRNIHAGLDGPGAVAQTVSGLQRRGVRFLACMQSVAKLSRTLAAKTGEPEAALAKAIVDGLLPGVTAVPAMIVAANRAQEAGLTYAYLG